MLPTLSVSVKKNLWRTALLLSFLIILDVPIHSAFGMDSQPDPEASADLQNNSQPLDSETRYEEPSQMKDLESEFGSGVFKLFPELSSGSLFLSDDNAFEDDRFRGSLIGVAFGLNFTTESWNSDVKLGWLSTKIDIKVSEEYRKATGTNPTKISTSFGELHASPRFRLSDNTSAGASLLIPFGVDSSFAPTQEADQTTSIFLGAEVVFQDNMKGSPTEGLRIGIQAHKDMNNHERNIILARASIGYAFPVPILPGVIYKQEPKIIYKFSEKITVDAGIIYFDSKSHILQESTQIYIKDLAELLLQNHSEWTTINLTGFTDQQLANDSEDNHSMMIGEEVIKILNENGIFDHQIEFRSMVRKVETTPTQDGLSKSQKSQRVELTISGPTELSKLKQKIFFLMQRHKKMNQ